MKTSMNTDPKRVCWEFGIFRETSSFQKRGGFIAKASAKESPSLALVWSGFTQWSDL
jgi:predicted component of type VI protein secretion system